MYQYGKITKTLLRGKNKLQIREESLSLSVKETVVEKNAHLFLPFWKSMQNIGNCCHSRPGTSQEALRTLWAARFFAVGAVLRTAACFTATLGSSAPHPSGDNQNVSGHDQMSAGRQNCPRLRTTALRSEAGEEILLFISRPLNRLIYFHFFFFTMDIYYFYKKKT